MFIRARSFCGIVPASLTGMHWTGLSAGSLYSVRVKGQRTGDFDLAHLKAIHRHLFQDVYDWAGKVRTDASAKTTISRASPPPTSPRVPQRSSAM